MGARLLSRDDPAGSSLGKAVQGLKDNMVGGVFPRQVWKRGFFLQVLHVFGGKALASKDESAFIPDLIAMKLELPGAVPPEMRFDLYGVPKRVGKGEVIFLYGKGASGLSAVQGAVLRLGRE